MKTTLHSFSRKAAFLGMLLAAASVASAQTTLVTTSRTTTTAGTVSEFTPDYFVIAKNSTTPPTRYTYSKTTTYQDENGNPVAVQRVRTGAPVTVYYNQDGDKMVATKVVVRKTVDTTPDGTVSRETTTTTAAEVNSTEGVITSYKPSAIAVKSGSSPAPVSYVFTQNTVYVDDNGNPVSAATVRSGQPVTIYYSQLDDHLVATRVVVHPDPNAVVIEHTKTTTTTTETTNP